MAKGVANGKASGKISASWRLASRLDYLRLLLDNYLMVSFGHVCQDANKEVDVLANAGMDRGTGHQGPLENFHLED